MAIRWHNGRENGGAYPFRQPLSDRHWATTPGLAREHTLPMYQTTIKTNNVQLTFNDEVIEGFFIFMEKNDVFADSSRHNP